MADEHLVFRHKPSWETRYGDVLVTYNERGLRDRPILPKAEGEYRILALGDSVTFGWGVPQNQIFAFRVEQLLQGRLQRPVRVINSGVGGYNTVQEVTYFKQEGITFQPDLVMLTYIQNDIEENDQRPFDPWTGGFSSFKVTPRHNDKDDGETLVLSIAVSYLSLCLARATNRAVFESFAGWRGVEPFHVSVRRTGCDV